MAIKAQVQVDFFDKFPLNYAVLSCGGLILFSVSMAIIQSSIERHAGHRYYTRDVQLLGIGMAMITLCSVPFVPAWVGNLLFGIAVISQIAIPMIRAMIAIEKKGEL